VVYSILAAYQLVPAAQAFERARAATDRALAISPDLPEALTAGAMVALWYEWDLDASETLARRAVKLAPGLGIAHEWLGWAMLSAERFDEAEAAMSRALELDPLNTYSVVSLVFALNMGNRASRALELVRAALERSPADAELHRLAGLALLTDDRYAEAAAELRRSRELNPANAFVAGNLASALALSGEREEARRIADEMIIGAEAGRVPAAMVALALNALGDRDHAFAWLNRALESREFWMSMVHVDSEFWRLRDDPRFDEIVRKVGVRR
jgi:Flp pilus assembly protein TadD